MKKTIQGVIIVAAAALALSLLIGFMAGVRLVTVVLRATVSSAVAAGLAFGLQQLAVRALPGLLDSADAPTGEVASTPVGAGTEGGWSTDSRGAGSAVNIVVDDGADVGVERYVPEMVEEVEESMTEESERFVAATHVADVTDTIVVDEGVLDQLPDISAFSGAFVATDFVQQEDEREDDRPSRGGSGGGGRKNSANDPETIARAMQTMMRRDAR